MKQRLVILSIDDICSIFRDYCHMTGFPEDAVCDTLLMNPQTRKMRLIVESPLLGEHEPPEMILFTLKRTFTV